MRLKVKKENGFTLIELVILIIIMGIFVSVASQRMSTTIDTARFEQTRSELRQLDYAISGNPDLYTNGTRSDYGYVGDVGSLPPDLEALYTNSGGFSSWDGPYIQSGSFGNEHTKDAWSVDYVYTGSLIRSTGSGTTIEKQLISSADLLNNSISGFVVDANNSSPGIVYKDSLLISITYPNGSGSYNTITLNPRKDGSFSISNIPIGNQTLSLIYIPENDTVTYRVGVDPGSQAKLDLSLSSDLW